MGSLRFRYSILVILLGTFSWNSVAHASTVRETQDRLNTVKDRISTAIEKNNEARDALAEDPQDIEAATAALNEARLAAFAADFVIDEILADPPNCDPLCLSSILDLILAYIDLIDLVDIGIANTLEACGGNTNTKRGASLLTQGGLCEPEALDPVAANLEAADKLLDEMLALLPPIVPTSSEWSMAVMSLLLVTAGTMLVRQRRIRSTFAPA